MDTIFYKDSNNISSIRTTSRMGMARTLHYPNHRDKDHTTVICGPGTTRYDKNGRIIGSSIGKGSTKVYFDKNRRMVNEMPGGL